MPEHRQINDERIEDAARREFLGKAGRFAAVTPPAITLLLGTSLASPAIAASNGTKPGYGWGDKNHVHTGPPGLQKTRPASKR